jgi:hypothetical protein
LKRLRIREAGGLGNVTDRTCPGFARQPRPEVFFLKDRRHAIVHFAHEAIDSGGEHVEAAIAGTSADANDYRSAKGRPVHNQAGGLGFGPISGARHVDL